MTNARLFTGRDASMIQYCTRFIVCLSIGYLILLDYGRDYHPFNVPSFLGSHNAEDTGGMERDYRTFKIITQKTCWEPGKVRHVSHEHGILTNAGETNCPDEGIIIR